MVIEETFDLVAELVISTVIPSKEAKAEIEIGPVVIEAKIRNYLDLFCSISSRK